MSFCTAVNCIDGRVQLPVIEFMTERFSVQYVDMITEPGPNRILAGQTNDRQVESMVDKVRFSIEHHDSTGVAVIGHHDCKGNPAEQTEQTVATIAAVKYLRQQFAKYEDVAFIGLWVDKSGSVSEISAPQ
jgi:hypothetical protein